MAKSQAEIDAKYDRWREQGIIGFAPIYQGQEWRLERSESLDSGCSEKLKGDN